MARSDLWHPTRLLTTICFLASFVQKSMIFRETLIKDGVLEGSSVLALRLKGEGSHNFVWKECF